MILKKRTSKPDKKVNPFIGALLFLISIILLVFSAPLGFIYGLFYSMGTRGVKGIGEYLLKIAISIDQLGNVIMQHLLNTLWIKGGYRFGNRDETISSALGRNNKLGTLTGFGRAIDKFLDVIDPKHSLNSIDYYVEPSEQIIDKLAWVLLVDGSILSTRSEEKEKYDIPCGKREPGETDAQALTREIKRALNVDIDIDSMYFLGIFEAQADGHKPGVLMRKTCYTAAYAGKLLPNLEIAEIVWLNYKDRHMVSEVNTLIFDYLNEKGELL